ncbi:MAG: glutathione S-transferase family protein [Pseudomonadota bacterium]
MLTLVHAPMSRSDMMRVILEEIGAEYDIREVTVYRRDGSGGEDANNPHPHKQVPALIHKDAVIWEQSAIAIYLSELYPDSPLVRAPGHPERGPFLSWISWYAATFEHALIAKFDGVIETDPGKKRMYERVSTLVETQLASHDYLMGDAPTIPDFFLAGALNFVRDLLPASEVLDAYSARMDRPIARRLRGQG